MAHVLSFFARALNWTPLPFVLSLAIILVAIYAWQRLFYGPASHLYRSLVDARATVAQVVGRVDSDALARMNESFRADPDLTAVWERYASEVYVHKVPGVPAAVISVNPSGMFFNFDALVGAKVNLGLIGAIPNVLLGIGLCFTFIGLIAALWFAGIGVSSDSTEAARLALGSLLHAATFKFVTSLVGLGSSIAFTIGERWYTDKLGRELILLANALDGRIAVWTEQRIRYGSLEELRRQTSILEALAKEQGKLEPALSTGFGTLAQVFIERRSVAR